MSSKKPKFNMSKPRPGNFDDDDPVSRVSFITCATWVPRGVAKSHPDKIEITKEDLEKIISETKGSLEELEEVDEADYEKMEVSMNDDDIKDRHSARKKTDENLVETEKELSFRYNLDDYDDDLLMNEQQLGQLTVHASNEDDPLMTIKEDDDDSEREAFEILPSDNLIAVGHVEGDAATLEVYVYNADESSFYVHHDILLPSVPLCMEWLNYDSTDVQLKPGNLMAIGSMSPVINVWDLDVVDSLEPTYSLGSKGRKKKKIKGVGHSDAVLTLSWNSYSEHVLASGSVDQTVILWDLQNGTVAQQLKSFKEKVQSTQWHHKEPQTLLAGACDGFVRMFDCRAEETYKAWKLDGEVECVIWDTTVALPFNCLASTDTGIVYGLDARQDKPLWTLHAHNKSCTAIQMSKQCPGCLLTVSADQTVKVWDIADDKPVLVEERDPHLGLIHCLASSPDDPFVFCFGGDNRQDNFRVWDIREARNIRLRFCPRVGLPTDELDEELNKTTSAFKNVTVKEEEVEASQKSAKSKVSKIKGSRLDKKKKL